MLEETRAQLNRRATSPGLMRVLGETALRSLVPQRGRMQAAADLMRVGQDGVIAAFMGSSVARRLLPEFARQGYAMTPAIAPRAERALERVAGRLPRGARMEAQGDSLVFHPAGVTKARVGFFTSCVME